MGVSPLSGNLLYEVFFLELPYLMVQPEREPGHDDDHEAGDVDGHQVERQLPGKRQINLI